ncbi:hypothetical protein CSAL01_07971 [Colletotrichum salicis]|uniref:Uncharacterized protein n=1 Tax=Colletotrichum salicis TaxID=1209931 RepID=A0A135UKP6_9PEZI|nr:hypothetical protein CSAL01_07971 [Colletotrichum salicis]
MTVKQGSKGNREENTHLTRTPRNTNDITTPLPQLLDGIQRTPEPFALLLLLLLLPLLTVLTLTLPRLPPSHCCGTNLTSKSKPTTSSFSPSSSLTPIPTRTTLHHLKTALIALPTSPTPISITTSSTLSLIIRTRL